MGLLSRIEPQMMAAFSNQPGFQKQLDSLGGGAMSHASPLQPPGIPTPNGGGAPMPIGRIPMPGGQLGAFELPPIAQQDERQQMMRRAILGMF